MLKKFSLLLVSVILIGTGVVVANARSKSDHLYDSGDVSFEIIQVNIQPGNFHQMGSSARMSFSGNATSGSATLHDGNVQVASGTYRVNGNILVVNWRGHGTDEFLIVSPTELRDSIGTWRRM